MNKEDKLILGTLAGVDLILSPEHYEEYKGTLNKQLEEANEENKRLNNIIDELEEWLRKNINDINAYFENTPFGVEETYKEVLDKLKELKENK